MCLRAGVGKDVAATPGLRAGWLLEDAPRRVRYALRRVKLAFDTATMTPCLRERGSPWRRIGGLLQRYRRRSRACGGGAHLLGLAEGPEILLRREFAEEIDELFPMGVY